MSTSGMDPVQTQPERTTLAWQRTFVSVLTVAGTGSLRFFITGEPKFAAIALMITVIAAIPIVVRQSQIRRGNLAVVSWQPLVLVVCIVTFAAAGLLAV